ncbi:receptor-type tyrosine-protein phosphatase alpha-like isoform X2 [Cherax quadricarinatus]|uniref:receptor-type tyrosine-protein phosphatase alpha-like isoform X2 n=1 Tax=Cherax quadricarinatus TaxID=27406 RepID=UPI00387E7E5F
MVAESVVAEPWESSPSTLWSMIIIPFLVIIIIVAIYFRRGKLQPMVTCNTVNRTEDARSSGFCTTLADITQDAALTEDSIYETIPEVQISGAEASEGIYENINTGGVSEKVNLPITHVQAYFSYLIKSGEAVENFWSTSETYLKSTYVGQKPENKLKNRSNKIIPYDDTRVLLSVIDGDPHSDYINASHVSGYGNIGYIAAQGPKDTDVSTIGDFWRMIMEQDISAIIMVANFFEGGKCKVGKYQSSEKTLEFDGYSVSVIKKEHFHNFNLSCVQVTNAGETRIVQHYHYTGWPENDIPNEANSLAQIIRLFCSSQNKGGAVVHCSTGTDRTGTVLLVLLMYEMLRMKGRFNPLEAIEHLRNCRLLLVESQPHYNFSLQVLEEVLIGEETIAANDSQLSINSYLNNSSTEFSRIKTLSSLLTHKSSSNLNFFSMNRNSSVFPADFQLVQLHLKPEKPDFQYVDAVSINNVYKETLLVTEHPLPATLYKFWKLVLEKGCSLLLLLNNFDEQSKEVFPDVIPDVGGVRTLRDYTIQVHEVHPYGNYLTQHNVTITDSKKATHMMRVLQVRSWPHGRDVPPIPDMLPTIAELILQNISGNQTGPSLVCCGDGVTVSGLVSAVTLSLERLQTEQCLKICGEAASELVSIYRQ